MDKSNKSVYISLHNEGQPAKVVIGGKEIDLSGVTYLLIEIKAAEKPRYVVGHGIGANLIADEVLKSHLDDAIEGPPQDDTTPD